MQIFILRAISFLAICTVIIIMWYPDRMLLGLDLRDGLLQGAVYAVCILASILSLFGRLRNDPYFEFRVATYAVDRETVERRIFRIALSLVLMSLVLELGQMFIPGRRAAVVDFLINSAVVCGLAFATYLVIAFALRTPAGKRVVQFFVSFD